MRPVDLRIICRDLGLICALVGMMSLGTLAVAAAWGEWDMITPFAGAGGIALAIAAALYFPLRGGAEAQLKHGLVIAAIGWLLVALLGGIPFLLSSIASSNEAAAVFSDYGNAVFEAMSGFTTTGLSVVSHPEELPHTLQWWRSFSQWIGGIGIIVMVLGFIPMPIRAGRGLFFAERETKIHPSITATIRTMWWIYLLYTFVGVILLWGVGMGMWDAINHSMTALSTGGFSTVSTSMGNYPGWGVRLVVLVLMLLGAMSFVTHYDLLRGARVNFRTNFHQTRWLVLLCASIAVILLLENLHSGAAVSSGAWLFQAVSAATTTGFQTESLASWSEASKLVLVIAMFIGGAAGSTAGGIKVMRAAVLLRGMGWWLNKTISSPQRVLGFRIGGEKLSHEDANARVQGAAVMFFAWLVCTLVGTLVLMHFVPEEFTMADSLFEVVSAQSTVGLSVGITSAEMSLVAKIVLILNMWMGRLEVLPVLVMFRALFRGFN